MKSTIQTRINPVAGINTAGGFTFMNWFMGSVSGYKRASVGDGWQE
jgi:hypothetical protein